MTLRSITYKVNPTPSQVNIAAARLASKRNVAKITKIIYIYIYIYIYICIYIYIYIYNMATSRLLSVHNQSYADEVDLVDLENAMTPL